MYIPFPPADVFNNSFAGCDERIRKIQKKRKERPRDRNRVIT
jgi:hypothetical protein